MQRNGACVYRKKEIIINFFCSRNDVAPRGTRPPLVPKLKSSLMRNRDRSSAVLQLDDELLWVVLGEGEIKDSEVLDSLWRQFKCILIRMLAKNCHHWDGTTKGLFSARKSVDINFFAIGVCNTQRKTFPNRIGILYDGHNLRRGVWQSCQLVIPQ
jgi:hypothetical protein